MGDVDKLKIEIDRDECIGDGICADEAPNTFEMDDDEKAVVKEGSTDSHECILGAAENCPTDAIRIAHKDTGETLYPKD